MVLISTSCDIVASSIFNNIFLFIGKKTILVKTTGHERPKNFVVFFVSNFRVRLIHTCDLYSNKYGSLFFVAYFEVVNFLLTFDITIFLFFRTSRMKKKNSVYRKNKHFVGFL